MRTLAWAGIAIAIVATFSNLALAQIRGPFVTLEAYDSPNISLYELDVSGKSTVVVLGDVINLADTSLSPVMREEGRTKDIVVIARRITIGPDTNVYLKGRNGQFASEDLRGGDLYLVAPTIEIDTLRGPLGLQKPWDLSRDGGRYPGGDWGGRDGQVHVFVDSVVLSQRYRVAKRAILQTSKSPTPIPKAMLGVLARGFSPTNGIQEQLRTGQQILWTDLATALDSWIEQEPPGFLVARELSLKLAPKGQDSTAVFSEAKSKLPSAVFAPWFEKTLAQLAGSAEGAMGRHEYETANAHVQEALSLSASAPAATLASESYARSMARLRHIGEALATLSFVERVSAPQPGAPPVEVVVIRDFASRRIEVLPNLLLFSAIKTEDGHRVGFVSGPTNGQVRVALRGRLAVDPWVLQYVRDTLGRAGSSVEVASSGLQYRAISFGALSRSGTVAVSPEGNVDLELRLSEQDFAREMAGLGQLFGVEAVVQWQHSRLPDLRSTPPLRVNASLRRSDGGLVSKDGRVKNEYPHRVVVEYVIDGKKIQMLQPPVALDPGATLDYQCQDVTCFAPGSAFKHEIDWSRPAQMLLPVNDAASIARIEIENLLSDDPRLGGQFVAGDVFVEYKPTRSSSSQAFGPFRLAKRGELGSKLSIQVLGAPNESSELKISGRAHWSADSYQDLLQTSRGPLTLVQLDTESFAH
jgi:hypothetical protein